ncbi:hypothetical protein VOLCADRAFT_90608 [Volvox carteri f. nagariensis]|uniref:NADH dehydrogenase [ubiquinone] iron-sulfur protein 4, mitochondrial n=1 Tax=Volvox carteri f. nagariensis TaxID=3068 RepID=D8TUV4_VOLCA|nr:uncharacterized protein VOLCADRAFT_90608 [Volvox carteri f. nagariensis]EFJ48776.1 hypothetical protein VOLCADRAFT_90608 [Volvox carteri f. nagariensis]|eukprot:XP_002950108.1 hypothetical protein VOLCADRAFT_90608 [Volvox carteri f. nagariensis]
MSRSKRREDVRRRALYQGLDSPKPPESPLPLVSRTSDRAQRQRGVPGVWCPCGVRMVCGDRRHHFWDCTVALALPAAAAARSSPAASLDSHQAPDYSRVMRLAQQISIPGSPGGNGRASSVVPEYENDTTQFTSDSASPMPHGAAGVVSGVRDVALSPRRVLVFSSARSPEQQGRQRTAFNRQEELSGSGCVARNSPHWGLEFLDVTDKWENRLIGWTSSPDTKHQAAVALQFYTAEEAIAFCNRQGWQYEMRTRDEAAVRGGGGLSVASAATTIRGRRGGGGGGGRDG